MVIYVKKLFLYFLFFSGFKREIYVTITFTSIFSLFFWFANIILPDALILPVSQLQTQQLMTSQIRSHRIFSTDLLYSCVHFVVEIDDTSSLNVGF